MQKLSEEFISVATKQILTDQKPLYLQSDTPKTLSCFICQSQAVNTERLKLKSQREQNPAKKQAK